MSNFLKNARTIFIRYANAVRIINQKRNVLIVIELWNPRKIKRLAGEHVNGIWDNHNRRILLFFNGRYDIFFKIFLICEFIGGGVLPTRQDVRTGRK